MYGKIFSTMYDGSMFGAGSHVFAVMGYVISKQQPPDFNVELHPPLLAAILGESEERVELAVKYLSAPDARSRSEEQEGRRLIKVGSFTYHVVNGAAYHAIRNYEERKIYNREAQAKFRAKQKLEGNPVPPEPSSPRRGGLKKPTHDDLANFLPPLEAEKFLNHYESCGWVVGKKPMKDWKAAVRGWIGRSGQFSNGQVQKLESELTDAEIVKMAMQ